MSKLHFYRTIGKDSTWFADGDGTESGKDPFQVTISEGSVTKGNVYEIRQGTSSDGDQYNCQVGAIKGKVATFQKVPVNEVGQPQNVSSSDLVVANQEYLNATIALRAALEATKKSVLIRIAQDDLRTLKDGTYQLCFAKKVGDNNYNVVWQSYGDYIEKNNFSWTPQYQLFGSNTFQAGVTVDTSTDLVSIGLGETSTLDKYGILNAPVTGGPENAITMDNQYKSIHPGLNQLSTGIHGGQVSTPIYVAPSAVVKGSISLKPIEKVLVWFEQNIETSTMFSDARSMAVEIDLTDNPSATRLYKDQVWSTPS